MTIEEQKQQWMIDILNDPTNWGRFYIFADWLDDTGLALDAEQWRYRGQYFGERMESYSGNAKEQESCSKSLRFSVEHTAEWKEVAALTSHHIDKIWCESKGVRYIPHWPSTEADLEKTLCTPQQ